VTIEELMEMPNGTGWDRWRLDLVIEALHIFTAAGEPEVFDGTDVGNAPMAASFARCNYEVSGRFMVFT
jgi:hypothetical protein